MPFVTVTVKVNLRVELPEDADDFALQSVLDEMDYSFQANAEDQAKGYKVINTEIEETVWEEASEQP